MLRNKIRKLKKIFATVAGFTNGLQIKKKVCQAKIISTLLQIFFHKIISQIFALLFTLKNIHISTFCLSKI